MESAKKIRNAWDYSKDEMLIELIRNKTELYDVRSPKYSDTEGKQNSWIEIGRQLRKSGRECKYRWESLRAQYRKRLKKRKSKSGAHQDVEWKYEEQMGFVKDYMKDGGQVESAAWDEDMDEVDEDVPIMKLVRDRKIHATNSASFRRKIKRPGTSANKAVTPEKTPEVTHPLDTFFLLMSSTVKKFSPVDQHHVKNGVFALVSDMEAKYLNLHAVEDPVPTSKIELSSPSPTSSYVSHTSPAVQDT